LVFVLPPLVRRVVAVGFYRGWIRFKTTADLEAEREGVRFEIDRNKIQPDVGTVRGTLGGGDTQAEQNSAPMIPRTASPGHPSMGFQAGDVLGFPSPGLLGLAHRRSQSFLSACPPSN
jgi:hypothetical protein